MADKLIENTENKNPLLDINTSFEDYLRARTRNSSEHIVDGKMDYAFDGDYALKSKITSVSGWSKFSKSLNSFEIPNEYKRALRLSETASSMLYPKAYNAVNKCSERLETSVVPVLVKSSKDAPELYSLKGEDVEPCIVVTADVVEICTYDELCYLFGCEIGRLQNNHCIFRYAFGITNSGRKVPDDYADVFNNSKASVAKWIPSSDLTADRAGIICLDDPSEFAKIYISVRKKCIPDSFGNTDGDILQSDIMEKFDVMHKTPVRNLKFSADTTLDERRIMAGLEFTGCEVLYSWRPDLNSRNGHLSSKQSLEIRCEILADGSGVPGI